MVDDFLASPYMPAGARTKADYRLWALRFAEEFKDDPAAIFEEPDARGEVNKWRNKWAHSPKQFDYAGTVVTRILNWAVYDACVIKKHHCAGFRKIYKPDRAHIVWTPEYIAKVLKICPAWVARILVAACETGLRPADLVNLTWSHVIRSGDGYRIRVATNKRKRVATIPAGPELIKVIEETPKDRSHILVGALSEPIKGSYASQTVKDWRNAAGLTCEVLGYELHLHDARGTAATRLMNAGLTLAELASHMGWSVRHTAAVIEHYALVSEAEAEVILAKLAFAKHLIKGYEV